MSRPVSSKLVQQSTVKPEKQVNVDKVVDMKGQTQLIRAALERREADTVLALLK